MKKQIFKNTVKLLVITFFMWAIIGCQSNAKSEKKDNTSTASENEIIPDSIVQFLLNSAINDFSTHQSPTPVDFRNIKLGYLKSTTNEKVFLLCGEFLSKENEEWVDFTTMKTLGYEQYLGKTQYCREATLVLTDESLTRDLKHRWDNVASEFDFLIGTWKRENKEQFEVWEKKNGFELHGYSYNIKNNEKSVTETLVIKKIDGRFVYEATVPDQNDGRTIRFRLNPETDSIFSFENHQHDFPKKIQYKKLNEDQLNVRVLGDKGGFSYIQKRQ